jgi:hypothetical protein
MADKAKVQGRGRRTDSGSGSVSPAGSGSGSEGTFGNATYGIRFRTLGAARVWGNLFFGGSWNTDRYLPVIRKEVEDGEPVKRDRLNWVLEIPPALEGDAERFFHGVRRLIQ